MNNLKDAVKALKKGKVIIFPTDTAYGIGCRVDNEEAINKLFKLRKRSADKAVPILASDIGMVKEYVENIDREVVRLMEGYWPGGLTIVLRCKVNKIPRLVRGGGKTIGFRIPKNKTAIHLIQEVGVPILAPSANFSGHKTPFLEKDLDPKLLKLVDNVIASDSKNNKLPSTVIDCSVKPWKVLRQGVVKVALNTLRIDTRNNKEIIISVNAAGIIFETKALAYQNKAQSTLPLIVKTIKKAKLTPTDIEAIEVETGPGSFTGVRVGVAIANAFGFGLGVKINGKKPGMMVAPKYHS